MKWLILFIYIWMNLIKYTNIQQIYDKIVFIVAFSVYTLAHIKNEIQTSERVSYNIYVPIYIHTHIHIYISHSPLWIHRGKKSWELQGWY